MVTAHQTFGDMLRWNPYFHTKVLEGGFDEDGNFVYIPFSGLQKMAEYFKRKVIGLFLKNDLITEDFAKKPAFLEELRIHLGCITEQVVLNRPGIDNSVQILTDNARVNLPEYISKAPVSLKKLHYEPFKGRILLHTQYYQYFGENVHIIDGCDFLAELTRMPARAGAKHSDQGKHIPPKGIQYIRRYGLYASRTRGKWTEHPEIIRHAPTGWKAGYNLCARFLILRYF